MRALIGPLNPRDHRAVAGGLGALDARCFDRAHADIAFDPASEPIDALWSRLPERWEPDLLIWWSPEYSLVPEGIERCPVPSIAVLGDWNLGLWATAPLLEAFDWVVTDRRGVDVLGPQLQVPVDRWPAFSFDSTLHRRRPGDARDIDVLFVGNVNPNVQIDRARWVARLARLAERHRVLIAADVWGDAYAALLNRARIVWNRSIRGELNMRAYEAPACGALLLMEQENLEVREVFTDGVSCVLYGAGDLEARIERHLADPERLHRIADAGWLRVQSESYPRHLERLLDSARSLRPGPRPFAELPPWRRDYWLALHALAVGGPRSPGAALQHLGRALPHTDRPAAISAALGAVAATAALAKAPDERGPALATAARLLGAALALEPEDTVTRMNLGWVSLVAGRVREARAEWLRARAVLGSDGPLPVDRVPVPFGFDRFRTEWEGAALAPEPEARAAGFRPLLLARVAASLAEIEHDPDTDVAWWAESVMACAGIEDNVRRFAQALDAAGHPVEAAAVYARALDTNPLDWEARLRAATLAAREGDATTLQQLLAESRQLVAAAPMWSSCVAALDTLSTLTGSPA
jgi:tetratricopeptide (TPR) repeat protein